MLVVIQNEEVDYLLDKLKREVHPDVPPDPAIDIAVMQLLSKKLEKDITKPKNRDEEISPLINHILKRLPLIEFSLIDGIAISVVSRKTIFLEITYAFDKHGSTQR